MELLDTLDGLDFLISPSNLQSDFTGYSSYHKFMAVLKPLLDKGLVVKVPSSGKGDLIASADNLMSIVEDVLEDNRQSN